MTIPVEAAFGSHIGALAELVRNEPLRYAFVSNSMEVGEAIRGYVDGRVETLTIRPASMEAAVPVAREMLASGTEVIIAGGGTGNLLAQTIGHPVVKLERDPLDLLLALVKAREIGRTVAVTSFAKRMDGVAVYERLLDMRIFHVVFSSSNELTNGIEQAVNEGAQVVVGNGVCRQVAATCGVTGIVVMPRECNVQQTLREARAMALARRKERRDLQEMRTIVETSRDGLVVLDMDRTVKVVNEAAIQILRPLLSSDESSIARFEIPTVLGAASILHALESGEPEFDRVRRMGPIDVVLSFVPIHVDSRTVGVVCTLREATRIQNMERKVREKLYAKGFVARYSFASIKGGDPAIVRVIGKARRFAQSNAAIMIDGETGTGKELLAQSIHNASARSEKPFVAINCSALSETLLESELFGYEDGAFTGARRGGKIGLFELAQGGTLFLDEVADVSSALQMRLLRVLEEKQIMRLGGDRMVPVDVRVISSTQRPLGTTDAPSTFRRDLYFRLATLKLRMPPLRERLGDIPEVMASLFERYGATMPTLSEKAWQALRGHEWKGNVRELDSLVRTYIALAETESFSEALFLEVFNELREENGTGSFQDKVRAAPLKEQVRQFERQAVARTLRECGSNRNEAARRLGISLNSLWRKSRIP